MSSTEPMDNAVLIFQFTYIPISTPNKYWTPHINQHIIKSLDIHYVTEVNKDLNKNIFQDYTSTSMITTYIYSVGYVTTFCRALRATTQWGTKVITIQNQKCWKIAKFYFYSFPEYFI